MYDAWCTNYTTFLHFGCLIVHFLEMQVSAEYYCLPGCDAVLPGRLTDVSEECATSLFRIEGFPKTSVSTRLYGGQYQTTVIFIGCEKLWESADVSTWPTAATSRTEAKVKVKGTPVQALRLCTGRTAHRGSRGIALPFHDHGTRRGWGVSVRPRPLFTPGKDTVPIVQEAGWAQGRSGQVRKISLPPGFDPRTVQPVASRYSDWTTRSTHNRDTH